LRPVPLKQFSSIQYIDGEPDFNHFDGQRSVLVSGSVDDQVTTSQAIIKQALEQLNATVLYPDVRILNEGGAKETQKSMKSLLKAFMIAVFAIFLLLVLLFNSYTQPLLVLSAIPFSAIGVIWAFFLHAQALSFFAMLGGLALIGVIVNDSLVMGTDTNHQTVALSNSNPNTGKALSALQALGFKVKEAEKMLSAITDNSLSTEQLIRLALQNK
jgi:multidrug efflux pump subunit AcrB